MIEVVHRHDGTDDERNMHDRPTRFDGGGELLLVHRRIGTGEVAGLFRVLLNARTRAGALVVDLDFAVGLIDLLVRPNLHHRVDERGPLPFEFRRFAERQ